jgi:micrococcal nuclease
MMRIGQILTCALLISLSNANTSGASSLRSIQIGGPVSAQVLRIVDGDTVEVSAYPWPQQRIDVLVRIRGIDAPELHGKCEGERVKALRAKNRLVEFLNDQPQVILTDISGDKYFGRVLANLGLSDGQDAASVLILEGLVQPYDGGKKPAPQCN